VSNGAGQLHSWRLNSYWKRSVAQAKSHTRVSVLFPVPEEACQKPLFSQNHRMAGVGRNLCGSSSPTSLPEQDHPEQAAQDCIQAGLEYLQKRRLHNLPGQPGPGLRHPQREEVLPHVQLELPLLQFVPVAPCPVTGNTEKSLAPSSWHPPCSFLCCVHRPWPSFSTSGYFWLVYVGAWDGARSYV